MFGERSTGHSGVHWNVHCSPEPQSATPLHPKRDEEHFQSPTAEAIIKATTSAKITKADDIKPASLNTSKRNALPPMVNFSGSSLNGRHRHTKTKYQILMINWKMICSLLPSCAVVGSSS